MKVALEPLLEVVGKVQKKVLEMDSLFCHEDAVLKWKKLHENEF